MAATTKTLYDTDFVAWTAETAADLRSGRLDHVDLKAVAEEIESFGKSDQRAARSQLLRLLLHLIKMKYQAERRTQSWLDSISDARLELETELEDSPSLVPYLNERLAAAYRRALDKARSETGLPLVSGFDVPAECPWTLKQLLTDAVPNLIAD